jgi:hypothetical protein
VRLRLHRHRHTIVVGRTYWPGALPQTPEHVVVVGGWFARRRARKVLAGVTTVILRCECGHTRSIEALGEVIHGEEARGSVSREGP